MEFSGHCFVVWFEIKNIVRALFFIFFVKLYCNYNSPLEVSNCKLSWVLFTGRRYPTVPCDWRRFPRSSTAPTCTRPSTAVAPPAPRGPSSPGTWGSTQVRATKASSQFTVLFSDLTITSQIVFSYLYVIFYCIRQSTALLSVESTCLPNFWNFLTFAVLGMSLWLRCY